jgi:hypothetical protein
MKVDAGADFARLLIRATKCKIYRVHLKLIGIFYGVIFGPHDPRIMEWIDYEKMVGIEARSNKILEG